MDQRRVAIVTVAAIHLLLLAALRSAMVEKPYVPPPRTEEPVLVVTFIDETELPPPPDVAPSTAEIEPASPAAPVAAPEPAPDRERLTARFVESATPDVARPPPSDTDDAVRIVNPDGSLRLSQEVFDAADAKPAPGFQPKDATQPGFMAHKSPVDDRKTRFDKYWVPDKETLGQELARKYPIAALLLQGVNGDRCPPRSIDPECENDAQPAFQDDPFPDEDILD